MADLAKRRCVPCRAGTAPLEGERLAELARQVPEWQVISGHHLEREFSFPDFRAALAFTNRAGAIAEEQGHHPDILLGWGKARVTIWTHVINGLTESDFILAARIDLAVS